MKTCSKCGVLKEFDSFCNRRLPSGKMGYRSWCKDCEYPLRKAYVRTPASKAATAVRIARQYRENPTPTKERAKKWAKANPERVRASARKRYLDDPIKFNLSAAKWTREHPVESREAKKKAARFRYKTSPQARIVSSLRSRLRGALRGTDKAAHTLELLGCPVVWLEAWLESLFRPGMSWANYGPIWHIDHIKPCAWFDLTIPEQQKICFHWTNLQPLFASENFSKQDRYEN